MGYFAPNLLPRNNYEWFRTREVFQVDDLVLELDPNQKRALWKLVSLPRIQETMAWSGRRESRPNTVNMMEANPQAVFDSNKRGNKYRFPNYASPQKQ